MKDGILKPYHPSTQLFILLALAFCCLLVLQLIGQSLLEPLYGINISSNPDAMDDHTDQNVIGAKKLLLLLSSLGMFVLPAFIFSKLISFKGDDYLMLRMKPNWKMLLSLLILIPALFPISNALQEFNSQLRLSENIQEMQDANLEVFAAITSGTSWGSFAFNILLLAVIPAIGEELIFRGIIMRLLARVANNIHAGIWVSGFLFSLMHGQPHNFLPMMMMGVLLGYLLVWSGTIWVPIVVHLLFNSTTLIVTFFVNRGDIIPSTHSFGADDVPLLIAGLLVTGSLIYYYIRESRWKQLEYHFMKH
jgi:membrane protease YdiL (CAAX protease family)